MPNSSQTSPWPPDIPETRITKVQHKLPDSSIKLKSYSNLNNLNSKSKQFLTVILILNSHLQQSTKLWKNSIALTTLKALNLETLQKIITSLLCRNKQHVIIIIIIIIIVWDQRNYIITKKIAWLWKRAFCNFCKLHQQLITKIKNLNNNEKRVIKQGKYTKTTNRKVTDSNPYLGV